jgi:hypothetical protein
VFVAVGIKYAMRMRRGILSSVTCMAVPYFSTLFLISGMVFGKKSSGKENVCFDFL